ncbi:MAG: hypothetical protein OXH64_11545 [Rhodospirillaceae bacterium]|nr:hypothetical protein [Rhodospirillaceae bacterium]
MSFFANFNGGEGTTHSVSAPHDEEAGRRAGLSFNPAGDPAIDCVKAFSACAMQAVIDARNAETYRYARLKTPGPEEVARHADAMRNFATALTQLESGKMFAVNGVAATLADRG